MSFRLFTHSLYLIFILFSVFKMKIKLICDETKGIVEVTLTNPLL